jgi:hypothetical protein
MLIDAVLRTDAEYPSQGSTEKIVWIVLMVFLQPAAIAYYLLVYRKAKRGTAGGTVGYPSTPTAQTDPSTPAVSGAIEPPPFAV